MPFFLKLWASLVRSYWSSKKGRKRSKNRNCFKVEVLCFKRPLFPYRRFTFSLNCNCYNLCALCSDLSLLSPVFLLLHLITNNFLLLLFSDHHFYRTNFDQKSLFVIRSLVIPVNFCLFLWCCSMPFRVAIHNSLEGKKGKINKWKHDIIRRIGLFFFCTL